MTNQTKTRIASAILALILLALFIWEFAGIPAVTSTGAPNYSLLVGAIIAALAAAVIAKMFTGEINLALLVSEDNGNASLSRFQFLLFSFVIAACYFMLFERGGPTDALPNIPPSVLGLIGISGGSYLVAKGIQKSAESGSGSSVTGITLTNSGYGYTTGATVSLTGGGGTGAAARVVSIDGATGAITGIAIVSGGSGYASAPIVGIVDPRGTGAAAVASIG